MSFYMWSSSVFLFISALLATLDLLGSGVLLIEGARIKIHMMKADDSLMLKGNLYSNRIRESRQTPPAPQSACIDVTMIDGSGLPEQILNNTRFNTTRVRFYSSNSAKEYLLMHVFTRKVSGLESKTVGDVFNTLLNANCYPFFYGGAVRDQFLGKVPGDVDVEVDCDTLRVYNVCVSSWGEKNCQINTRTRRAHIGQLVTGSDDLLDFASTNATFFAPLSALEYTVNSLAYDVNADNNIILDLPGNGVFDVCNKTIRIPSDDASIQSWDEWRKAMGGRSKLYRFWKLRTKAFSAVDHATKQYIVNHTITAIRNEPNSFKKFYCDTVYGTGSFNNVTNTCEVTQTMCTTNAATAENYKQHFREDFGDSYSTLQLETLLERCGTNRCASLLSSLMLVAVGMMLSFELKI